MKNASFEINRDPCSQLAFLLSAKQSVLLLSRCFQLLQQSQRLWISCYLSEVQQILVNSGVPDVSTMLKSLLRLLSNEEEEEETSPELLDVS